MKNTEKRVIELEPQTIESANKISSEIMDAAKKDAWGYTWHYTST